MADYQQNFLASLQGGLNFGQQVKGVQDQRRVNQLAGQAYGVSDPAQQQSLLGQMAAVNPGAAQQQQKAFANDEERRNTTMVNMAKMLTSAPEQARPGLYQRMVPTLAKFGLQDLPQQYDAQTAPIIDQAARSIYQAYSGTAGQTPTDVRSFQMMTQGLSPEELERARRINLGLAGRESSAAIGYQKVKGPDGVERLVAVDPRQIGAQVVGDGAGYGSFSQPAPMTGGTGGTGGNHFAAFSQLATEFPAVTMTSGARSAERNAQVGGQPNSQHLSGSAADYAVPANQKPAFISRARQLGYQAIDEGDHIHLQLPRGSAGSGGQNIFAGRRPEDEAAAVESAKLGVQQQFLPQELAMRTNAALQQDMGKAQVAAQTEQANTARSNGSAARVYEQGMSGVYQGMQGTSTGPVVGRLPAMTTEQQIAQGSVAAMAPVLKQMFRVAGEGTFTDKDQDLLMQMVPTRTDTPEAREAKMANVDNIVRAKLNMPPPTKATNPQTGETLYLRFGQWVKK